MTNKVYITQETNVSFIEAERFGEVHFLTRDDFNNTKNSLHNRHMVRELTAILRTFDPEKDYIAPAGSPYVTAVVFLLLGLLGINSVKVLRWNNRDLNYTPIVLESYAPQDVIRQMRG